MVLDQREQALPLPRCQVDELDGDACTAHVVDNLAGEVQVSTRPVRQAQIETIVR
jgi:hypothetical protein